MYYIIYVEPLTITLYKGGLCMTKLFFVRHAQSEHAWEEDRTRPLTNEGLNDTKQVLDFFRILKIDHFYCSPYKRSIQTIESTAQYFGKEIILDERLREREKGPNGNIHGMFQRRWQDKNYYEDGGESLHMVQNRNIAALMDILENNPEKNVIIGTHGTALSSILNYFDNTFNCNSFLRIIDWMPYIIELDFKDKNLIDKIEHIYIEKEFQGHARADKRILR